jgi:hypothetical protein
VHLLESLFAGRDLRSWILDLIACPMYVMEETDTHAILPLWNQSVELRKGMQLDQREESEHWMLPACENILAGNLWFHERGSQESSLTAA